MTALLDVHGYNVLAARLLVLITVAEAVAALALVGLLVTR